MRLPTCNTFMRFVSFGVNIIHRVRCMQGTWALGRQPNIKGQSGRAAPLASLEALWHTEKASPGAHGTAQHRAAGHKVLGGRASQ
jgi:hypothetical protein